MVRFIRINGDCHWISIPAVVGLIEAFTITGRVANYNQERAIEIAGFLR